MSTPFDKASSSIPVTVVTTAHAKQYAPPGAKLLHLDPALHQHEAGNECVACAARGDIRAMLFDLLKAERRIGVKLTESYAMWPGSSVSGLYIGHPQSHYFGVAKVERDQVEDYAQRKAMDIREVERWLGPILNYDPASYLAAAAE